MPKQTKWKVILSNIKIIADTIGSLAPIVKLILVGLSALCLTLIVSDFKEKSDADKLASDLRKHREESQRALALVTSTKKEIDILQKSISVKEKTNEELTIKVSSLSMQSSIRKKQVDSLKSILKDTTQTQTIRDSIDLFATIVEKQDTIIKKQDTTITTQQKKITNLEQINVQKDSINKKLTFALDSVTKVVTNIPLADKCYDKIIFCKISKPSRKTAFTVGVIVGVITTGLIQR